MAATWNEDKNGARTRPRRRRCQVPGRTGRKLAAQAKSLADRVKARDLDGANPRFQSFAKKMEQAS